MGDLGSLEPLEDVDGVSESIVAQGQVIPADAIAAGTVSCTSALSSSEMCLLSAPLVRHELLLTCSNNFASNRHRDHVMTEMLSADGASQSIHIRTGPLLSWALDYAGTLSVLVQTETAWCVMLLLTSPEMPSYALHASQPVSRSRKGLCPA